MANNMVFKAQRCRANAIQIPGLVSVSVNPKFLAVSRPVITDLVGHGNADRSVHSIDGSVEFEDCTLTATQDKLTTLLNTAPTSAGLIFHTSESGLDTFTKHEIGANANTKLRFHGGTFVSRFDQVGKWTAQFSVSHNTSAMSWSESWKKTRNRSAANMDTDVGAYANPVRIGPLTSLTVGGTISPSSLAGLSYNVAGVLARSGAGDFSGEVVDVIGYNVSGNVIFKDDKDAATSFVYDLLTAAVGDLVGVFREHGGTDSRTLTLKNVSFEPQVNQTYSAVGGHAEFSVPFSCGFDATIDTLAELIAWVD